MDFLQDSLASAPRVRTEFTSKALDQWAYENKVTLHFIKPDLWRTRTSKAFMASFREKCLNEHWFLTLDDAGNHRKLADRLQPGAPA